MDAHRDDAVRGFTDEAPQIKALQEHVHDEANDHSGTDHLAHRERRNPIVDLVTEVARRAVSRGVPPKSRTRSLQLAARRVRQTLAFPNGPRVLVDLLSTKTKWSRPELHFELPDGVQITCPNQPGARVAVYEVFAEDAYRIAELSDRVPESPVVLDIGGQVGCFSIAFAARRGDASVHAFEASPTSAEWLERNVRDNLLTGRVVVHAQAVSSKTGTLRFVANGDASVLSGLTAREGSELEVPCLTFADAVAAAGGHVDLVKIDTEGAEYEIVLGSERGDWAGVGDVVLEYHQVEGHDWSELESFLGEVGLTTVRHEPAWPGQGTAWLSRNA
jgi:FkbM family methyltransferase